MDWVKPHPAIDNADGINPWNRCPSTHCERAQECRSPNDCNGTGLRGQAKTNAQHQAAYRNRQREAFERRGNALAAIIGKVQGKTGPVAAEVRKIAEEALR